MIASAGLEKVCDENFFEASEGIGWMVVLIPLNNLQDMTVRIWIDTSQEPLDPPTPPASPPPPAAPPMV